MTFRDLGESTDAGYSNEKIFYGYVSTMVYVLLANVLLLNIVIQILVILILIQIILKDQMRLNHYWREHTTLKYQILRFIQKNKMKKEKFFSSFILYYFELILNVVLKLETVI